MSCIQQILRHGTSHVSQAYKPNGLSLREIGDKVSQETNVLIIIKQVFTTYFSELSNSPEKNANPQHNFPLVRPLRATSP